MDFHREFRIDQEPSLLDLIFTNEESMVDNLEFNAPLGKSDHVSILWTFYSYTDVKTGEYLSEKRSWYKADFKAINEQFASVEWEGKFQNMDVEQSWNEFKQKYEECVDKYVPYQTVKASRKQPWFRKKVKEAVRKKQLLFKKSKRTNQYVDKLAYVRQRNETGEIIRNAKRNYEAQIMRSVKTEPKKFYSYVKSKQKVNVRVSNLKKEDGSMTEDDKDNCEVLSEFFSSVFTKESGNNEMPNFESRCEESLDSVKISEDLVMKKLSVIKVDKSQGPDGISPRILKECRSSIAKPLYLIFKKSIESGTVPHDFKNANVTPIFKKGNRSSPENFRPVSITSVPCKILESIIRDSMVQHLDKHKLMSKDQHGFVKGRSCLTNLLETLDDITSSLDEGEGMDMVFLDYKKAFDTVPHKRLLYKVRKYGFGDIYINWIKDFLTNRKQRVHIRGQFSEPTEVLSGVPQGSVLGPLLFILFVNDIPDTVNAKVKMYADDTKVYERQTEADSLQRDLERLEEWSRKWLMKFNELKCKVMYFGKNNPKHTYLLGNTELEKVTNEKDLGVYITDDAKPSLQCVEAAKKASQALGFIKRTFTYYDRRSFAILYKTYIRPHMEFAVQAWNPYLKKDIECLEKIQHRATKLVPELRNLEYRDRLRELNLYTLEQRRERGDLIEVYKIITGKENIECEKFFKFRVNSNTRGNSMKIYKPRLKKSILQRVNFFSIRVVNAWNELPDYVISSTGINSFKNNLDRYYRRRHGATEASA